jgi:LmbE family N-acetylglucosaminyl deacetylase
MMLPFDQIGVSDGFGLRFYLFAEGGLQRISQLLMDGLAHGKDAMPQFAGTKKVADVLVEMDGAKPIKTFLTFDENGQVHKDLIASGFAAMEAYRALERGGRTPETVAEAQSREMGAGRPVDALKGGSGPGR